MSGAGISARTTRGVGVVLESRGAVGNYNSNTQATVPKRAKSWFRQIFGVIGPKAPV